MHTAPPTSTLDSAPDHAGAQPTLASAASGASWTGLAGTAASLATAAGLALAAPPAGPLPDPTRPPAALQLATAASGVATRIARADGSTMVVTPGLAAVPVLQGVQVPAQGAPTAMVDGRLVKVGDTIGERTVITIDRQGVTLRGSAGIQRLPLLGDGAKQPAGSIVISRSTSFEPEAPAAKVNPNNRPAGLEPLAPTAAASPRPEPPPVATEPANPVALAGKNRP
jgi:hypothetical protein